MHHLYLGLPAVGNHNSDTNTLAQVYEMVLYKFIVTYIPI